MLAASFIQRQKLAKNYMEDAEACQLYLRGRFYVFKLTPPEIQKGILYFQQAIEIDPNYALAYAGLGETDKTFEWLEKGYQQHDPKMAFLKVEPKWNNLRNEPRFIELMRRMNFE